MTRWNQGVRGGLLILFSLLAAAGGAEAAPWELGGRYQQTIDVVGRQVPLPQGEWVLAGIGTDPAEIQPIEGYGVIFSLILFKLAGPVVEAFALVHANAIAVTGGWGLARDCLRSDLLSVRVYDSSEHHASCAFVAPVVTRARNGSDADRPVLPAWRSAQDLARRHQWQLPAVWVEAGFRVADQRDLLDVRYGFNPEALGFPTSAPASVSESEWTRRRLAEAADPRGSLEQTVDWVAGMADSALGKPAPPVPPAAPGPRQAYVGRVIEWTATMAPLVRLGFKRALRGVGIPPIPSRDGRPIVDPMVEVRSQRMEAVRASFAIDPALADADRRVTPAAVESAPPTEMSSAELSFWKLVSSRILNLSTSIGVNYLFLGDFYLASGLLLTSSTLHSGINYLEELAWNTYGPQRLRQAGTVDFTYVGMTE